MRVRWLQEARLEAAGSARFYREKDPELAVSLVAEVRERLDHALRFPEACARIPRTPGFHVRRLLFDRFEYALVFALLENELVVVALHHQHRKPGYWRPRLASVRP